MFAVGSDQLPRTADLAIVGGGIIGLSIARALRLRGIRDLILIERDDLGSEASSAAAGMLAPQAEADRMDDFLRLACHSRDLYHDFATALREETSIDIELEATGTLYVAFSEEDELEVRHRYDWQSRAGLPVESLDATEALFLEPCISGNVRAALRFPKDVQVENRQVINALTQWNRQHGVRMITDTTVESIHMRESEIDGLQTSRGFVSTHNVVIAAGAWTTIIDIPGAALPEFHIEPVRGQMVCFYPNPRIARHVIYSPRGYIVPRKDGRLLAGSTSENAGFEKLVTAAGIHSILSHAMEISPTIATLPLADCWAGFRPRAQDDWPVIGPHPGVRGLFYATGHYRNGILLAPITGELLASCIQEATPPPLLFPFSPERFQAVGVA